MSVSNLHKRNRKTKAIKNVDESFFLFGKRTKKKTSSRGTNVSAYFFFEGHKRQRIFFLFLLSLFVDIN